MYSGFLSDFRVKNFVAMQLLLIFKLWDSPGTLLLAYRETAGRAFDNLMKNIYFIDIGGGYCMTLKSN